MHNIFKLINRFATWTFALKLLLLTCTQFLIFVSQYDLFSLLFLFLLTKRICWFELCLTGGSIYLMNASAGIRFCLCNSVNAWLAFWYSQLVSSRHLIWMENPDYYWLIYLCNESVIVSYFRLHSMFICVCCDNASIICIFVISSGIAALAGNGVGIWIGAATWFDVTGTGSIGLNAVFNWAIVRLLTCSISFFMQKPLPNCAITIVRWNERSIWRSDTDSVFFSRKTPVTVTTSSWGYFPKCWTRLIQYANKCVWNYREKQFRLLRTVKNVRSQANDWGSCSDCGSSERNDTTGSFPHFSRDIRFSGSRSRFRFRLCGKNLVSLQHIQGEEFTLIILTRILRTIRMWSPIYRKSGLGWNVQVIENMQFSW